MFKSGPKRGSQKSGTFVVFKVPIPAWSPGWPWGGSQTQKHLKMELQTWIFCYLRTLLSPSLETLWKYFVCSLNDNLIVLDVNLLFSLLRLGGETYGGWLQDASKMASRCVPDASKMPQRCFKDASKIPQDASKMPSRWIRCLQYASRCLPDAPMIAVPMIPSR